MQRFLTAVILACPLFAYSQISSIPAICFETDKVETVMLNNGYSNIIKGENEPFVFRVWLYRDNVESIYTISDTNKKTTCIILEAKSTHFKAPDPKSGNERDS